MDLTKDQKLSIFNEVLETYVKDYMIDSLINSTDEKQEWDYEVYDELDNMVGGDVLEAVGDITKDIGLEDIINSAIEKIEKQIKGLKEEEEMREVEEFEYGELDEQIKSLETLKESL